MKTFFSVICLLVLSVGPSQLPDRAALSPGYALKAWQIVDGDAKTYLWSIEDQSNRDSPGALYKSLASPALRARVNLFPAGTKLKFHFSGGGDLQTAEAVTGKDFADFRAFCASRKIEFDFFINTD
jgi:hypothetical protein